MKRGASMKLTKINFKALMWPLLTGIIIAAMVPFRPAKISTSAWYLLAIFIATIVGCITKPMPIAGVALVAFTLTVVLKIVPMKTAALAFGNTAVWTIGLAYLIARGFIKTGLGHRVALLFVRYFGKKTLGLGYAIEGIDLVVSPAMPSNTARSGGVVLPIIDSLARIFNSSPEDDSRKKMGAYLLFTEFHANLITGAIFMTAMASNILAVGLAKQFNVNITWFSWFSAAIVPGIICLLIMPFIIYKMYPPQIKETPNAREWADKQLQKIGPMTKAEKIMLVIFIISIVLWMSASFIGLDATTVAFIAVVLLLMSGILTVKDILNENGTWNVVIWFSILIFLANQLNQQGIIPWFSTTVSHSIHNLTWQLVMLILALIYFYAHYFFASGTAQVTAMFVPFLSVAVSAGVPATLAAMLLCFIDSIYSSSTHYANGPASALFSTGYVKQGEWWKMNFILGLLYLVVFCGIGSLWMKLIGIW